MLVPERVNVPVPFFTKEMVPVPASSDPLKAVDVLLPPRVRVVLPAVELVTVPLPAREPWVRERPAMLRVPLLVSALVVLPKALALPRIVVPSPRNVPPV